MLKLTINATELWDEKSSTFIALNKTQTITLEHSLISISKWEAKYCKPFLSQEQKTTEETLEYIKCMTLTPNVDPNLYYFVSNENIKAVNDYIYAPMTATTVNDRQYGRHSREILTNELIYYYMIALGIPFECQKWHLNRLIMLIRVCSAKQTPGKKMPQSEIASRNRALNQARRAKYHSKG